MTLILPERSWSDYLLARLGRRRAYKFAGDGFAGPYVSRRAWPESFLRALLRPPGSPPPQGWFYPEDLRIKK